MNARFRRAVRHRAHFPTEQAALDVLYLVATQNRENMQDLNGKITGWKTILNTLTMHYGDRIATSDDQPKPNDRHRRVHEEADTPYFEC